MLVTENNITSKNYIRCIQCTNTVTFAQYFWHTLIVKIRGTLPKIASSKTRIVTTIEHDRHCFFPKSE